MPDSSQPAPDRYGPSNVPVPDPSTLTTDALNNAVEALKELFNARLDAVHKDLDAFRAGHEEKHVSVVAAAIQHRRELSDAQTGSLERSVEIRFGAVQGQFAEHDRRYQERYEAQNLALNAALDARQKAVDAALAAQVNAVDAALDAKDKSAAKSDQVLENRFAAIVEFRAQLQRETNAKVGEVKEQMNSLEKLTEAKLTAIRDTIAGQAEKVQVALASDLRARNTAAEANEKRFDAIRTFEAQISDQVATFVPRNEAETRWTALAEKVEDLKGFTQLTQGRQSVQPTQENRITELTNAITDLNTRFATVTGRDSGTQMDRRFDELIKQVDALRLSQTNAGGRSEGLNASWVYLLGAIAAIGTVISIIVVFIR